MTVYGVPSLAETIGLVIHAFQPSHNPFRPRAVVVSEHLETQIVGNGLSIEWAADGGMWSANIQLVGPKSDMEDWLNDGVGRHIEVWDDELGQPFEGFVNRVDFAMGALSASRGPLLESANRVKVDYTPVLYTTTTAGGGTGPQRSTILVTDADAAAKYGFIEKSMSGGQLLDDGITDEATQMRDVFLAEQAWPETSEQLTLGTAGQAAQVSLEVLGYVHYLDVFPFSDANTGTRTYSQKVQDVLAFDPNGILSTDYSAIQTNASLAFRSEDQDRSGLTAIRAIEEKGDVNDDPWFFGIGAGRKASYYPLPSAVMYQHRIADRRQVIEKFGMTGLEFRPWQVKPGQWCFLPDFLVGQMVPTVRRRDARYLFIERASFQAPYSLSLTGQRVSSLAQMLAKVRQ